MRRADRLFEIIQSLRRRGLVRARDLSAALEVSERTIYRDIQDLMASGVPIEGEAGVGYVLKAGFDLPPLMFKEQEIEALVLGARIVESWADPELAAAASDVIAKVQAVVTDRLRDYMANTALLAPPHHYMEPIAFDVAELRRALARPAQGALLLPRRPGRAVAAYRPAALPRLLRPGLDALGLVRAARRLPHLPPRPHGRFRRARRPLPPRARQDAPRLPEARSGLDQAGGEWEGDVHTQRCGGEVRARRVDPIGESTYDVGGHTSPSRTPAESEMPHREYDQLLNTLRQMTDEVEWVEFKEAKTSFDIEKVGQYFAALANEANLKRKHDAWLILGVHDSKRDAAGKRVVVGTEYRRGAAAQNELKKYIADHTPYRTTFRDIHELTVDGKRVLMFQIPPRPPASR